MCIKFQEQLVTGATQNMKATNFQRNFLKNKRIRILFSDVTGLNFIKIKYKPSFFNYAKIELHLSCFLGMFRDLQTYY